MSWTDADLRNYYRAHPTLSPPGAMAAPSPAERDLLARVRQLARAHSWLTYHVFDARKSEKGYPDLTLVRPASSTSPGRLVFAELKSVNGQVTQEQHLWLDVLRHSLPGVEVYCWRPTDWEQIVQILTQPREKPL